MDVWSLASKDLWARHRFWEDRSDEAKIYTFGALMIMVGGHQPGDGAVGCLACRLNIYGGARLLSWVPAHGLVESPL